MEKWPNIIKWSNALFHGQRISKMANLATLFSSHMSPNAYCRNLKRTTVSMILFRNEDKY